MSEALPATLALYREPCAGPSPRRDTGGASRVAGLVEALRRTEKTPEVAQEIVLAQDSLERRIRAHLSRGRVEVTLTDNQHTMISVRRIGVRNCSGALRTQGERRYKVRLHHMFADADPVITRALARYIAENDADASRILSDFIDANADLVRGRSRRTPTQVIFTAGEHHDLRSIFDELNARYFENRIEAAITWGPRSRLPWRRSIKLGSYAVEDRLIRIHRSLDRAFVPRFFVEWIVFHEMLHQVHPIRRKNHRREYHSKEFLADEKKFELHERARLWERQHLDALLDY